MSKRRQSGTSVLRFRPPVGHQRQDKVYQHLCVVKSKLSLVARHSYPAPPGGVHNIATVASYKATPLFRIARLTREEQCIEWDDSSLGHEHVPSAVRAVLDRLRKNPCVSFMVVLSCGYSSLPFNPQSTVVTRRTVNDARWAYRGSSRGKTESLKAQNMAAMAVYELLNNTPIGFTKAYIAMRGSFPHPETIKRELATGDRRVLILRDLMEQSLLDHRGRIV